MASVSRNLGRKIARSPELGAVLDEIARGIEANAIGLAAGHVDTGDFATSIKVVQDRSSPSGQDRLVIATDPAAASIELGHLSGSRDSTGTRKPVEGLHILGRAADAM